MGGADPVVGAFVLFHTVGVHHGAQLFEILLLFVDIHGFANDCFHYVKPMAGTEVGHQRSSFGEYVVIFRLLCFAADLHQVEDRGDAVFEEIASRSGNSVGLIWPQLAVDRRADTLVCQSF